MKKSSKTKCNCRSFSFKKYVYLKAPLLCASHFSLINHTRKLFWHSNLNEPQRKNFVLIIIRLSEVEVRQSSELLDLLLFECLVYSFTLLISKSLSLINKFDLKSVSSIWCIVLHDLS